LKFLKENNGSQISVVLERKKNLDEQQYFEKKNLLEKHFLIKLLKKEINEKNILKKKKMFFQKAWIKLITICFLAQFIKTKKEV